MFIEESEILCKKYHIANLNYKLSWFLIIGKTNLKKNFVLKYYVKNTKIHKNHADKNSEKYFVFSWKYSFISD